MAGAERQPCLFADLTSDDGTVLVNDRCVVRTVEGFRVVVVSGVILAHYAVADRMAEAYAMVNLVEHGWAEQQDVARAFGCSTRSVRRHQDRFQAAGLAALGRAAGYPPGRRRVAQGREPLVQRLKAQGVATREIARRLGVTPKAVRKLLKRLGWHEQDAAQIGLPITRPEGDPHLSAVPITQRSSVSASTAPPTACGTPNGDDAEPLPRSCDRDPADRRTVVTDRWRSSAATSCNDAPWRSIDVATECRSKCAAPRLGRMTPARANARSTITDTAQCERNGRNGARLRTKTTSVSVGGRPRLRYVTSASPSSCVSGRRVSRRPLPNT